jgi:hypothetical protein
MRHLLAAATLVGLAACSSGGMTPAASPFSSLQAAGSGFGLAPSHRFGAASSSDAEKIIIRSVGISYEEKGKEYTAGLNGKCTLHAESNGQVDGCYLTAGNTGFLEKSSFFLFSEPNAGGCRVAEGHYRGDITENQTIPIIFYWVTNKCYKY